MADISDSIPQSTSVTSWGTEQQILAELRLISFLLAPLSAIPQDQAILDNLRSEFLGAL